MNCNDSYERALKKIEHDKKCKPSCFSQVGPTGPTGPTGPSGGPTGPTGATGPTHTLISESK